MIRSACAASGARILPCRTNKALVQRNNSQFYFLMDVLMIPTESPICSNVYVSTLGVSYAAIILSDTQVSMT